MNWRENSWLWECLISDDVVSRADKGSKGSRWADFLCPKRTLTRLVVIAAKREGRMPEGFVEMKSLSMRGSQPQGRKSKTV